MTAEFPGLELAVNKNGRVSDMWKKTSDIWVRSMQFRIHLTRHLIDQWGDLSTK